MDESCSISQEAQAQLAQLGQARWNLLLVLVGVLINLGVISEQGRQLLCAALGKETEPCDLFPARVVSSLLILTALIFFYRISFQTAGTPAESCRQEKSHQLNALASFLVLAAAALRLGDLLCLQEQT